MSNKDKKPARSIALALVVAVVFAVGLGVYLQRTIKRPEPPKPTEEDSFAAQAARAELAAVEQAMNVFLSHVQAARFADAHALLSKDYRSAVTVEQFTAECRAAPLLIDARIFKPNRVEATSAQVGGATVPPATRRVSGVLVTPAGSVASEFVLVREGDEDRILALFIEKVPVLQAVRAP